MILSYRYILSKPTTSAETWNSSAWSLEKRWSSLNDAKAKSTQLLRNSNLLKPAVVLQMEGSANSPHIATVARQAGLGNIKLKGLTGNEAKFKTTYEKPKKTTGAHLELFLNHIINLEKEGKCA